jgi:hypothetical protein
MLIPVAPRALPLRGVLTRVPNLPISSVELPTMHKAFDKLGNYAFQFANPYAIQDGSVVHVYEASGDHVMTIELTAYQSSERKIPLQRVIVLGSAVESRGTVFKPRTVFHPYGVIRRPPSSSQSQPGCERSSKRRQRRLRAKARHA